MWKQLSQAKSWPNRNQITMIKNNHIRLEACNSIDITCSPNQGLNPLSQLSNFFILYFFKNKKQQPCLFPQLFTHHYHQKCSLGTFS